MKKIKIRFDRNSTIIADYDDWLVDFLNHLEMGKANLDDVRTLQVVFNLHWPPVYKEKWDGKPELQNFAGFSVMVDRPYYQRRFRGKKNARRT